MKIKAKDKALIERKRQLEKQFPGCEVNYIPRGRRLFGMDKSWFVTGVCKTNGYSINIFVD